MNNGPYCMFPSLIQQTSPKHYPGITSHDDQTHSKILYTLPPPPKRPSLYHRHAFTRLNLKTENMDLSSFTGFHRGSETYLNTRRNRSPAGWIPSYSSVFSFSFSSSFISTVSSVPSINARASSETVSSLFPATSNASPDPFLPSSKEKKVRFAHPVVTAVSEPKVDQKKVRFAMPLTNIPLRSKEEREGLRLPGTCYGTNTGKICDDAQRNYKGIFMCDHNESEEYVESSDGHIPSLTVVVSKGGVRGISESLSAANGMVMLTSKLTETSYCITGCLMLYGDPKLGITCRIVIGLMEILCHLGRTEMQDGLVARVDGATSLWNWLRKEIGERFFVPMTSRSGMWGFREV
ncbi:hypothetical protein PSPO01_14371 [Paraphaeosphaeria sporulosa]